MMITSTAEFATRSIGIGLDADDARKILGPEVWDAKTFDEQIDWLSKRTDLEVLRYLYKDGQINQQFMLERAREIKTR